MKINDGGLGKILGIYKKQGYSLRPVSRRSQGGCRQDKIELSTNARTSKWP